jgi:amino acid transporter
MVKEEFNNGESVTYTNFKTLMIINWVFFTLPVILGLIIIISNYKDIKINSKIQTFVAASMTIFNLISLALSIVGLTHSDQCRDECVSDNHINAEKQQKKYKPHFISLLILSIICIFYPIIIFTLTK